MLAGYVTCDNFERILKTAFMSYPVP